MNRNSSPQKSRNCTKIHLPSHGSLNHTWAPPFKNLTNQTTTLSLDSGKWEIAHSSAENDAENMIRTDSQDYGADEIICTSKITLLYKTTRFTSEIITLFRVSPQLFPSYSRMSPPLFLTPTVQRAACALHFEGSNRTTRSLRVAFWRVCPFKMQQKSSN